MSRIGKNPIVVPKGVEITVSAEQVAVKGPLGTLTQRLSSDIRLDREGDTLLCQVNNESTQANAMSGTIRALVANMVEGVTKLDALQFSSLDEVQAENWRKMILATAQDIRVILIKLADRLHNMRTMDAVAPDKRTRVARACGSAE